MIWHNIKVVMDIVLLLMLLSYVSEFKPVSILEPIFGFHPSWTKMKTVLTYGSTWPLLPLDDSNQLNNIDNALAFGNHKGDMQQPELLLKLIQDNVDQGFALPLPLNKIKQLPGILVALMNIQLQKTINRWGENSPKNTMTHNQSWKWQSDTSSIAESTKNNWCHATLVELSND